MQSKLVMTPERPQVQLRLDRRHYMIRVGTALTDSMKLDLARQIYNDETGRIGFVLNDQDKRVGAGRVSIYKATPLTGIEAIQLDIPRNYPIVTTTLQQGDNNFLTIDATYFLGPFLSPSPNWHPDGAVTRTENGDIESRLLFVSGYDQRNRYASKGVYVPDPEDDGIIYRFWSPFGKSRIDSKPDTEYPIAIDKKYLFDLLDNLEIGIVKRNHPVRLKTESLLGELLFSKSL